jgi:hypothetical protein
MVDHDAVWAQSLCTDDSSRANNRPTRTDLGMVGDMAFPAPRERGQQL